MEEQNTPPSVSDYVAQLREKAGMTTTLEKQSAPAAETPAVAAPAAPSATKLQVAIKALRAIERNVGTIIKLLEEEPTAASAALASFDPNDLSIAREMELAGVRPHEGRVVEGVFDGKSMVGSDGKTYPVPPNYASKSKLVEGDMLKVTITPRGNFIFKQIGPIERDHIIASLGFDATNGEYYATNEEKRWSLLKASITYFKGEPGDEVAILVPKGSPSKWAAVENVIKKNGLDE